MSGWGPTNPFDEAGSASEKELYQVPELPWLLRATRLQMTLAALGFWIAVFAIALISDWLLYHSGVSPLPMFAVTDGLAALLAALFFLRLVAHATERRRVVHERLRMVVAMNHHIRNALEVIQMSAHTTKDEQAIASINEAVTHISWALREILGEGKPPLSGDESE